MENFIEVKSMELGNIYIKMELYIGGNIFIIVNQGSVNCITIQIKKFMVVTFIKVFRMEKDLFIHLIIKGMKFILFKDFADKT